MSEGEKILLYVKYERNKEFVSEIVVTETAENLLSRKRGKVGTKAEKFEEKTSRDKISDYAKSCIKIIDYGAIASKSSSILSMMPGIELSSALSDNNNLINLRRRSKSDLFAIGFRDNIDFINKVYENIEDKNSSYIIRNAIFSGLVSRFDNILSKTIDIIIKLKPEVLKKSEISIGLFDISGEESFSSLKLKLITDFISGILLKSRNEQIKWIEDSLGIQIKSNIKVWDRFIEICERRNVYIHHDSIATQRYVEKLNSFKIEEAKDIKSGGVLTHGREYVFYSSDILY